MRLYLVIAAVVAVGLLVAIRPRLRSGADDQPHPIRKQHEETLPAATALAYARMMEVGRPRDACYALTKDAQRAAGCATANPHPRGCGHFAIEDTLIIRYDPKRTVVEVGSCHLEVVPNIEAGWQVDAVVPAGAGAGQDAREVRESSSTG